MKQSISKLFIFLLSVLLMAFLTTGDAFAQYCNGDGFCGLGEDCSSCPGDCGACTGSFACGSGTCPDGRYYNVYCDTHCGGGGNCWQDPECSTPVGCFQDSDCPNPNMIGSCADGCNNYDVCGCAGGCWKIGCRNGVCTYQSGTCGPTSTNPPVPPPGSNLGTLLGRVVWDINDRNCDGSTDPGLTQDLRYVQYTGTSCAGGPNVTANAVVNYHGPAVGATLPNLCNPQPYYSVALPPGSYTVAVTPPNGFKAISPITPATITTGGSTHVWFTVCAQAPTCTINGPATGQVGESYSWSSVANVPDNGDANVEIDRNTALQVTGYTQITYTDCSNTNSTCSINSSTPWTPATAGTYYVFCRGYNNGFRECRPFEYSGLAGTDCNGVPNTCTGPGSDCIPFTVTNPLAWFQTSGGDVHGVGVGATIPSTCTTPNCTPYFSLNSQ